MFKKCQNREFFFIVLFFRKSRIFQKRIRRYGFLVETGGCAMKTCCPTLFLVFDFDRLYKRGQTPEKLKNTKIGTRDSSLLGLFHKTRSGAYQTPLKSILANEARKFSIKDSLKVFVAQSFFDESKNLLTKTPKTAS